MGALLVIEMLSGPLPKQTSHVMESPFFGQWCELVYERVHGLKVSDEFCQLLVDCLLRSPKERPSITQVKSCLCALCRDPEQVNIFNWEESRLRRRYTQGQKGDFLGNPLLVELHAFEALCNDPKLGKFC